MKILKSICIGILLSVFEIILYYLVVVLTNKLFPFTERGVAWGIYVQYTFLFYIILICGVNTILTFNINKKLVLIFIILGLLVYSNLVISPFDIRPYRVILRLILGIGMTTVSFVFFNVIKQFEAKKLTI
jgi:hypothetical protein